MAEAIAILGVAGNAISFLDVAVRLSQRLKEYCSEAQGAPTVFKTLSIQLDALNDLCKQCQTTAVPEDSSKLTDVLQNCGEQVQSLEALVIRLLPKENESAGSKAWKAVKSIRYDKKIEDYVSILETYKTLLIFHLTTKTYTTILSHKPTKAARDTCYHFPSVQSSKFIARRQLLDELDEQLKSSQRDPRVVVLLGMGGQGKTSLALEYCRRERAVGYFKAIIWIDATSLATLQRGFASVADHLTQHRQQFANLEACTGFVNDTLESWSTPWLMVFDNYDQVDRIRKIMSFTPKTSQGSVLFTSRHEDCESLGSVVHVRGMNDIEGLALLLERTRTIPALETVKQGLLVVHTLGSLPLAIDQCAAYIRSRKITMKGFIDHYHKRKEKVLKHKPAIWDYQHVLGESDSESETPISVFTTWEMSFQQIHVDEGFDNSAVEHFLTILGFFSNLDIRMEMFQAYHNGAGDAPQWMRIFADDDGQWDQFSYQDVVSNLAKLSLLQLHEPSDDTCEDLEVDDNFCCVSIHPLVRDWIQLRLPPEKRREYIIESLATLKSYIQSGGPDSEKWPLKVKREVLSHLDACINDWSTNLGDWGSTCYGELRDGLLEICQFYISQGRYTEAESLCKNITGADLQATGADSEATWTTSILLTDIYLAQGRYQEVELSLREIVNNPEALEWPRKAHYLKNLARSHFCLGRYPEAEALYRRVLCEQSALLTPGDPKRLDTLWNLAQVCRNQGQFQEATALYTEVLRGYKDSQRPDHPAALRCMVDLANNYRAQALYEEASRLYLSALRGNERLVGADHPSTITTRLFIAINYRDMFQYEEAGAHLVDVIAQSEKILGAMHPDTLKAVMNQAINYDRQGRFLEAEKLYNRALEGRLRKLGANSPYTMRSTERLANLFLSQGRAAEAGALSRRILYAQKQQRDSSPDSDNNDGNKDYGDDDGSALETLFGRALERDNKFLGPAHSDRIETQRSLARVYIIQGRHEEARSLLTKVKGAMNERFGPDHEAVMEVARDLQRLRV